MAVRAVASFRESRWTGRRTRVCRYDAYWADGRVDFDVDLVKAMYRGYPADFEPIDRVVHAECPEVGAGPWVDERGMITDGPTPEELPGLSGVGRPRPYRDDQDPRTALQQTTDRAWRVGPGVAALAIGILMLTRSSDSGALGVIGVVCVIIGLASLASLLTGRAR